ncbi:MAG TPA: MFS transporter [Candidatus Acidoferrales bacterium]|nr:MFS transporter [Candidatus Acidoferrales bacterium]
MTAGNEITKEVLSKEKHAALRFVLLIGVVSLFADCAYEGARSITGPLLAVLGASAALVGLISGLGELLGYGLRLVSGRLSERTGKFWPITLLGYVIQMSAVPMLALAPNWQIAGLLIILERVGKATRNPPRDVMLSHAGKQLGGFGWVFGIHEAMDQFGALVGPIVVAFVLAARGSYQLAFAVLLVPSVLTLMLISTARFLYPRPSDMEVSIQNVESKGLPKIFWLYLAGAVLVAAGFADFSLIAFHFQKTSAIPSTWIPIFYSIAMAVSGGGSLLFGKLFDRAGLRILIPLTVISAASAPLLFFGGFWTALIGAALWGLGMGVHESIIPAAVATMVPQQRRPSAYGLFTAGYGIFWFVGSVVLGILYDIWIPAVVIFSVVLQLIAVPIFLSLGRKTVPHDAA